MSEKWKKERDARVAEQKKRMTQYGGYELQQKMVNEIKGPVMEAFSVYVSNAGKAEKLRALLKTRHALKAFETFPEPTKENTWHPNSHRLIEIREEFFLHCRLDEGRRKFIRLLLNFIIILHDYDPPYRMMIDWWAKQLGMTNWDYSVPVTVVAHNWPWWREEI